MVLEGIKVLFCQLDLDILEDSEEMVEDRYVHVPIVEDRCLHVPARETLLHM